MAESKQSSRTGSVCEDPPKSPVKGKNITKKQSTSRSNSVCKETESVKKVDIENMESKPSSRAGSVFDEIIKPPMNEKEISKAISTSRSSSINQENENVEKVDIGKAESKQSSRAGSICEEPPEYPVKEKNITKKQSTSRSNSVCKETESVKIVDIEKVESKQSSRSGSVCEEIIKPSVNEKEISKAISTSRSSSINQENENVEKVDIGKTESKQSSRTGFVCEDPPKSPANDNNITTTNSTRQPNYICLETEIVKEVDVEKVESKPSSTSGSVCDEPTKSPVNENEISMENLSTRESSINFEKESVKEVGTENSQSKSSSRAGSVCNEIIKPPVNEKEIPKAISTSRSSSINQENENVKKVDFGKTESKQSSRAGSVCDEPIKFPVNENEISMENLSTRESSINCEKKSVKEMGIENSHSKSSSRVGSVCEVTPKSPANDYNITTTISTNQPNCICQEPESVKEVDVEKVELKPSSRAGSVCDEPTKSPVNEKEISMKNLSSRSSPINQENKSVKDVHIEKAESKSSSRAESVCDEPTKSPVNEKQNSTSRSSSVFQGKEYVIELDVEEVESKPLSRAGSVSEETAVSQRNKSNIQKKNSTSRSNSICQGTESAKEMDIELVKSNLSSRAGSVSEDLTKMLVEEKTIIKYDSVCRSNSICQETVNTQEIELKKIESKASNLAESDCDKPNGSPVYETNFTIENSVRQSNSVCQVSECTKEVELIKSESKASNSLCQETDSKEEINITMVESISFNNDKTAHFEPKSCPVNEKSIKKNNSIIQSSCISEETESSQQVELKKIESKASSRTVSVSEDSTKSPVNETNIQKKNSTSRSNSICQESECVPKTDADELDSNVPMKANFINDEPIISLVGEKLVTRHVYVGNEPDNLHETFMNKHESYVSCTSEITSGVKESPPVGRKNSLPCETGVLRSPKNEVKFSTYSCNDINTLNKGIVEESNSLGRIGSLCEEITKFLTEDKTTSKILYSESTRKSLSESVILLNNAEERNNDNKTISVSDENIIVSSSVENKHSVLSNLNISDNDVKKSLILDENILIDNANDHVNTKYNSDCLLVSNSTVSNKISPNISTIFIEKNEKTGYVTVAQIVAENTGSKSSTNNTVIMTEQSENPKSVTSNITFNDCINKSSNVITEDTVKTCDVECLDDICSSSTEISVKQSLGVTLNNEDLGVTTDVVMQLKKYVHDTLHQCSSDDERPFTPHSESSLSRSTMNIDDDEGKTETDDEIPGSPMSTEPSIMPLQLDNQNVEISMDFSEAMQEHRITRGEDLTTETNGNLVTEIKTTAHDNINQNQDVSSDTVHSWGKPLGLPPVQNLNNNGFDPIREWGKPLGLPSPTQPSHELTELQNMSNKTTPKKNEKKVVDNKPLTNVIDKDSQSRIRRSESPNKLRSRSSSRMSKINPIYLDLIYVPHHGNSKYVSVDFFKRVRARNYVFSGTNPNKEVLNALIEGKQMWEDQDLEVTIIPTYDSDTLSQWVAENEELLAKLKIDLSPSASRCTIKLQDHNTSCSAYRLEF